MDDSRREIVSTLGGIAMTRVDTHIKNILSAASYCEKNDMPYLAFCFDGVAMDSLPLSSKRSVASSHHYDVTVKTASSSHIIKGAKIGPKPSRPDSELMRAMAKAAEGGVTSMTRLADMEGLGKGVSNWSDLAGLVPGVGKYLRGGGEFIGQLMQGNGLGRALGGGAMDFGLGALPPAVQIGLKGIQGLISYLQGMDMSKVPWLQGILTNLQKWAPMIASGIGYATMLGIIGPKKEEQPQEQPQAETPRSGFIGRSMDSVNDMVGSQGYTGPAPGGGTMSMIPQGALASVFSLDKMTKTSSAKDNDLLLIEIINGNKEFQGYGVLPKSLYQALRA